MDIREEDINLRKISIDDLPAIMVIENELFSDPWSKDVFQAELDDEYSFIKVVNYHVKQCKHNYLLEYKGEIVGFCFGWAIHDEYSVMNIGVKKAYQHQGLGSILMTKLIEKAIELACLVIFLEVRKSNLPAINLYKKFHFKQIGERKKYYQDPIENCLVMKLELNKLKDSEN